MSRPKPRADIRVSNILTYEGSKNEKRAWKTKNLAKELLDVLIENLSLDDVVLDHSTMLPSRDGDGLEAKMSLPVTEASFILGSKGMASVQKFGNVQLHFEPWTDRPPPRESSVWRPPSIASSSSSLDEEPEPAAPEVPCAAPEVPSAAPAPDEPEPREVASIGVQASEQTGDSVQTSDENLTSKDTLALLKALSVKRRMMAKSWGSQDAAPSMDEASLSNIPALPSAPLSTKGLQESLVLQRSSREWKDCLWGAKAP